MNKKSAGVLHISHKPYFSRKKLRQVFLILILAVFTVQCDDNDVSNLADNNENISGTGVFLFDDHEPLADKPLDVYYHIPEGDIADLQVLFVFHGFGRNAVDYRNAWIEEANAKGFIVIVPKFSADQFPGGDAYNLANIFIDGDNPSASTLNEESIWTFSVIEPLFEKVKSLTGNTSINYKVYGHSAGGQFAHRFAIFKPNSRAAHIVASAAGWYTVPDTDIDFPYGIAQSPAENTPPEAYFQKNLSIIIGKEDNDPNAGGLRRNAAADAQGDNRLERARHFFQQSEMKASQNASNFNWDITEIDNIGHQFEGNIPVAADILF